MLAAYTGAWYPTYFEVGVNWASRNYDVSKDFSWATPDYKNYGFAELLDFYTNGNYYWNVTLDDYYKSSGKFKNETDSEFSTGEYLCVEGGCKYSKYLLKDAVPVCGGLYCRRLQTGRKPIPESSPYELERIGRCDDFRHCTHYPQRMVGRTKKKHWTKLSRMKRE